MKQLKKKGDLKQQGIFSWVEVGGSRMAVCGCESEVSDAGLPSFTVPARVAVAAYLI